MSIEGVLPGGYLDGWAGRRTGAQPWAGRARSDADRLGPRPRVRPARRRAWRLADPRRIAVVAIVAGLLTLAAAVVPARVAGLLGTGGPTIHLPGVSAAAVVVRPGDTLWTIAQEHYPGVDPRVAVGRLRKLNGLADAAVMAGQVLRVAPAPLARGYSPDSSSPR